MLLVLTRKIFTEASTIGELSVDGRTECVTLEDPVRDRKIKGITAIPAGEYDLVLHRSPKFHREMPTLLHVPNFSGILIHWGNTAKDTEGCILVGKSSSKNFIGNSKIAFNGLYQKIKSAEGRGETLKISVS